MIKNVSLYNDIKSKPKSKNVKHCSLPILKAFLWSKFISTNLKPTLINLNNPELCKLREDLHKCIS